MATIMTKDGPVEMSDSDPRIQAYNALNIAASRMATAAFKARVARVGYKKAAAFVVGRPVDMSDVTPELRAVCNAMGDVLSGKISPDAAMSLLHEHDVAKQRLA